MCFEAASAIADRFSSLLRAVEWAQRRGRGVVVCSERKVEVCARWSTYVLTMRGSTKVNEERQDGVQCKRHLIVGLVQFTNGCAAGQCSSGRNWCTSG